MTIVGDVLAGWPHAVPAFHAGEQALQARAGMHARMSEVGSHVIRAQMPDPHRELFEKVPFMLVGALDAQRRPWATAVAGAPGFIRTPDAATLTVGARPLGADAIPFTIEPGVPLGMLGLELPTRRRNRVNGVVSYAHEGGFTLQVRQSFGNCAKYIHARELQPVAASTASASAFGTLLPAQARRLVAQADTFFIATASRDAGMPQAAAHEGVDVSHRGGMPGFVHVQDVGDRSVLTAPDYQGNFFFNTLGNVAVHPWAGLMFVDWMTGDLLLITGRAAVLWDGPELGTFANAQRLLRVDVTEGRWLPGAMPWRSRDGGLGAASPSGR